MKGDVVFMPYPGLEEEGKKEQCFFCRKPATQKAICGCGKSVIHCCDEKECKDKAAHLAAKGHEVFAKDPEEIRQWFSNLTPEEQQDLLDSRIIQPHQDQYSGPLG